MSDIRRGRGHRWSIQAIVNMAAPAVRVLQSQSDIVKLFVEAPMVIFDCLSDMGLIATNLICDKCMPIDALPRQGEAREMYSVIRNGEVRWQCRGRAHHKRTICHHAEFFAWQGETSANGRNNFNRSSIEQILLLTWCWCFDLSIEAVAVSAHCSVTTAKMQYAQCRRVCFAALDDREACPEAGLMGGEGHLMQIDECSVKSRRKRVANGRGRLSPGDWQEPHRGNTAEQAAIAQGAAAEDGNNDNTAAEDGGNDEPEGWVFSIVWWCSHQEKLQGIPNETRFFAVRNRNAATLLNLIQTHIAPGTQIWSDCWRAYARIAQLPEHYIHYTVNHSLHFTDSVTGVNTNTAEASWNRMKHNLVRTKRGVGKELRYHLAELWWKSMQRIPIPGRNGRSNRTKTNIDIFTNFLDLIRRAYPI